MPKQKPECEQCNGKLYYIENGEQYTCECVMRRQLSQKLSQSGVGEHGGFPSTDIVDAFKEHEDNLFPYLHVIMKSPWPQSKMNSVLGYGFVNYAFDMNCQYYSMNDLKDYLKGNEYIAKFPSDLLAVSYGLDGMFEGLEVDDPWPFKQYSSLLQRTIRCRINNRKPMWFFSTTIENDDHMGEVAEMLNDNNFHEIDFNKRI